MQELPTNKTNFLFEHIKDCNQTTHGGLQDPIVFIDSISSYYNCLGSVKDVFKWSHHGHIMLFSGHVSYTLFQGWTEQAYYQHQLVFQFSKEFYVKIIEFNWFVNSAFCGWRYFEKFHYTFFGRWFCSQYHDF